MSIIKMDNHYGIIYGLNIHNNTKQTYMKIFIVFFFWILLSSAQNFQRIDTIVAKYPDSYQNVEKLAMQITKDFVNDSDRVRAAFFWIAKNVVYDKEESGIYSYKYTTEIDRELKEEKRNKKLSNRVSRKGEAVCDGYATLFNKVCDLMHINSKKVTGASRTKVQSIGKRFFADHAWNWVEIDNQKYLIDITWATNRTGKGELLINNFYYLTRPEFFIKNHYPKDYKDTLLDYTISKETFLNDPFIFNFNYEYVSPINGKIKKLDNPCVIFQIRSKKYRIQNIDYKIGNKMFAVEDFTYNNDTVQFEIDISKHPSAREIIIFVNGVQAVGYKFLNTK